MHVCLALTFCGSGLYKLYPSVAHNFKLKIVTLVIAYSVVLVVNKSSHNERYAIRIQYELVD